MLSTVVETAMHAHVDAPDLKNLVVAVGADYVVVAKEEDLVSRVERILQGRRLQAVLSALDNPVLEHLLGMVSPGGTLIEAGDLPTLYPQSQFPNDVTLIRCQPEAMSMRLRETGWILLSIPICHCATTTTRRRDVCWRLSVPSSRASPRPSKKR